MIGTLPKSLEIDGVFYKIDSDFRTALLIMQMYNDGALSPLNKQLTMLEILFTHISDDGEVITNIPKNINEAVEKAMWFLDVGQLPSTGEQAVKRGSDKPVIDYEKDEQMLFSAVNDAAKKEVRAEEYMHWWTFHAHCQAIDNNSLISAIIGIRSKINKGIILDKYEADFYKENKNIIDINSEEQEAEYNDMVEMMEKERELLRSRR